MISLRPAHNWTSLDHPLFLRLFIATMNERHVSPWALPTFQLFDSSNVKSAVVAGVKGNGFFENVPSSSWWLEMTFCWADDLESWCPRRCLSTAALWSESIESFSSFPFSSFHVSSSSASCCARWSSIWPILLLWSIKSCVPCDWLPPYWETIGQQSARVAFQLKDAGQNVSSLHRNFCPHFLSNFKTGYINRWISKCSTNFLLSAKGHDEAVDLRLTKTEGISAKFHHFLVACKGICGRTLVLMELGLIHDRWGFKRSIDWCLNQ